MLTFNREPFKLRRAANGNMKMKTQATELQAAERDLKQLMADVTRAVEKAQEAVAKIAPKTAPAKVETESTASSARACPHLSRMIAETN